tara:strand:- start:516 stop:830 length:315 start_codon:yes stop_codon:yes gene_type:complete
MNIIYVNLYRLLSATSVTVLANLNKVFIIVIAAFVFKKSLSLAQVIALAVVMGAGVWFGTERKKTLQARAEAAAVAANVQENDDARELIHSSSEEYESEGTDIA